MHFSMVGLSFDRHLETCKAFSNMATTAFIQSKKIYLYKGQGGVYTVLHFDYQFNFNLVNKRNKESL